MDEHQIVWNEKVADKIIKNLEKRRMAGSYAATSAQAKAEVLEMIPQGASVFRCGSMTAPIQLRTCRGYSAAMRSRP